MSTVDGVFGAHDDCKVGEGVVEEAVGPVVLDAVRVALVGVHPHVDELHVAEVKVTGSELKFGRKVIRQNW